MNSPAEDCEIREAVARIASHGQQRLERLLAARNRLEASFEKLRSVRVSIGAELEERQVTIATAPPNYRRFFPALDAVTAEIERVAEAYEREIDELAALF